MRSDWGVRQEIQCLLLLPVMATDVLTVIVASVSCVAFCLVIWLLVLVLYRRDPLCCRYRPNTTEHDTDDVPYHHSRPSLIGIGNGRRSAMSQEVVGPQLPGRLFIIGKPNNYHLSEALPRLPSYESVRKKDRQAQIHAMISEHFGLSGHNEESPPSYEETVHRSLDMSPVHLHSVDVHLSIHTQDHSFYLCRDTNNPCQPPTGYRDPSITELQSP